MSEQRRIMVIAGGDWQVPLIRKAKAMGHYVINTNLYPDSPGFRYADLGLVADVLDSARNLDHARRTRPHAVVTDQSDIAVPTVAFLSETLGLPGIGTEIATLFTDKSLMRETCRRHGFPTPPYALCDAYADARRFGEQTGYPLVVKPPSSQSSRGVSLVNGPQELAAAFTAALEYSPAGTVLVEGYVGGVELTVDGIRLPGRHHSLATSCKTHYAHNPMIASRLWFSHRHSAIDYPALHTMHDRLIEVFGLPFGLTHAEYKYWRGEFYLIEVAARGGGTNLSSHVVPAMSGIDTTALLIRMTLGEPVESIDPQTGDSRVAAMEFLEFAPGRVESIRGLERARSLPGILDAGVTIQEGQVIEPARDDRSRHGHVIAAARSGEALERLFAQARQTIEVDYV